MTPRDEPPVVGLRDVYNATRDTQNTVTVLVVRVEQVVSEIEGQREENRRIWDAIDKLKMRTYVFGGGIAVVTFLVANLGAVIGIVGSG